MVTEEEVTAEWDGELAVREWSPRARARADSTEASIAVVNDAEVTVGVEEPAVDDTAVEMAVEVAVEDVSEEVIILLKRDVQIIIVNKRNSTPKQTVRTVSQRD